VHGVGIEIGVTLPMQGPKIEGRGCSWVEIRVIPCAVGKAKNQASGTARNS
jgi:hypothetical protein